VASQEDGDDKSIASLSLSAYGSMAGGLDGGGSLMSVDGFDGAGSMVSGEESQSVVLKASQLNLGGDGSDDSDGDEEESEEDKALHVVVVALETRGVPVGTAETDDPVAIAAADAATAAAAVAAEDSDDIKNGAGGAEDGKGDESAADAPAQSLSLRFPFMQLVLGDQKTASDNFAVDSHTLNKQVQHRILQADNSHHKHGHGHHGKKGKKKSEEDGVAVEVEEVVDDDIPFYPLHFPSPSYVCVKEDEAYVKETEGLRRMVERKTKLLESAIRGNATHVTHHAKHHLTIDEETHPEVGEITHHKPEHSINEVAVEDKGRGIEEEVVERAPENTYLLQKQREEEEKRRVEEADALPPRKVICAPNATPLSLRYDPGPQGTTQMMVLLMDERLAITPPPQKVEAVPAKVEEEEEEEEEERADEHHHRKHDLPHISAAGMEPPFPHTMPISDPVPMGRAIVDLAPYMPQLMNKERIELPWVDLTMTTPRNKPATAAANAAAGTAGEEMEEAAAEGDGETGAKADGDAEAERSHAEGVKLIVKMMSGKEIKQMQEKMAMRQLARDDTLAYALLTAHEKDKLREEEERKLAESGMGGRKAGKMHLIGDDGLDLVTTEDGDIEHRDGTKIDTNVKVDRWAIKFKATMLHPQVSKRAKAQRILEALDDSFSKLWLLCRHLALILECFEHSGKVHRSVYFGSYRSDLVCQLYERLVDVHNFDLVLRVLEPYEVSACICRIGWLNFFNPLRTWTYSVILLFFLPSFLVYDVYDGLSLSLSLIHLLLLACIL
jgi:hypothetical protein